MADTTTTTTSSQAVLEASALKNGFSYTITYPESNISYTINYTDETTGANSSINTEATTGNVSGCVNGNMLSVYVVAHGQEGDVQSNTVYLTPSASAPDQPTPNPSAGNTLPGAPSIYATVSDSSLTYVITPPSQSGSSPITQYRLGIRKDSDANFTYTNVTTTEDTLAFNNGTMVSLVAYAISDAGTGPASNTITVIVNNNIVNQVDLSKAPYYDRFNPDNNWDFVALQPDRPAQSSEINEIQSIFSYNLKKVGNMIANDGDMQSGMSYTQSGNTITVQDGQVYLDGEVRSFKSQSVTLTGKGMEHVGVLLQQDLVTSQDDSSIANPVVGSDVYGSAGADRIKSTVELVLDNKYAATIYTFNNGQLYMTNHSGILSKVNDLIANSNFKALGSYRVGTNDGATGFSLSVSADPNGSADNAQLSIGKGDAFVQGYEVEKPATTYLSIPISEDTQVVNNEQHVYDAQTTTYSLSQPNVSTVTLVSAQVQETFTINHGSTNGIDNVVDNLISIDKVYTEGSNAETYVQGTDYNVSGNSIDWSLPNGAEPTVNTSYLVQATYNKPLQGNGVDYALTKPDASATDGITIIDFSKGAGQGSIPATKPKDGGYITVTYSVYLYRTDVVTLDRYGNFTIHQGKPDIRSQVMAPSILDPNSLVIGSVTLYPNKPQAITDSAAVTNLTFEDITKLKKRIESLEYNEVVNSLDTQAIQKQSPLALRGVLTDSFVTLDKYDESYDTTATANPDKFKASVRFDFTGGTITVQPNSEDTTTLSLDSKNSTVGQWTSAVTAPFTLIPIVSQMAASSFMAVDYYNYLNRYGKLALTPSADNWVDEDTVTVDNTSTTHRTFETVGEAAEWASHNPYHSWSTTASGGSTAIDELTGRIATTADYYGQYLPWTSTTGTYTGYTNANSGYTTLDTVAEYMRSSTISFYATGLQPLADNLALSFAGHTVPITPAQGYEAGTNSGTIKTKGDGSAQGTFVIPSGINTGTVEVVLSNDLNDARSTFTSEGIHRTITDTINKHYISIQVVDPLAETFQAPYPCYIGGIKLYFGSKSATSTIKVQIRGVNDDLSPNREVRAETVLNPSDVSVSDDGYLATQIQFDRPIYMGAGDYYAIVIESGSPDYTLAVAREREKILGTDTVITNPAYVAGTLYTSANAAAWSPQQDTDLKFEVDACQFNSSADVEFNPITGLSLDQFALMASYLTPDNTGCTWEYRVSYSPTANLTDQTWLPLSPYVAMNATGTTLSMQIRATFTASDYVSPILNLDDLQLLGVQSSLQGDYVTINVDSSDAPYNTINLEYLENIPSGSAVIPQYSTDAGQSWTDFSSVPTTENGANGWVRVSYKEKLPNSATANKFKLHLALTAKEPYNRPHVAQLMSTWTSE